MNAEYQEGVSPKTWMKSNSMEYDPVKMAALERVLNDKLAGSTAERHRVKLLPDGFEPVAMPSEDEKYKAEYDEFIIKRIASCFGVSPTALGVLPRSGLGGSGEHKGQQDAVDAVSQRPMEAYVVEFINALSRRFLGMSKAVTFNLNDESNSADEAAKASAFKTALESGQMTLNDVRGDLGLPLYDMAEADEPFIVTSQGPQFLKGSLAIAASGETIGDKDEQTPEVPKVPEVPEVETDRLEAEKAAFAKFVKARTKSGKWRDFEFVYADPIEAENLNTQGRLKVAGADPKWERL